MNTETDISYSAIESEVLKLKIVRCNANCFDEAKLFKQMISGEYDICRLKVSAEDEMAPVKLNSMGFPYAFSGSIRRYKTKISSYPPGEYYHKNLQYEMYDGSQDELLKFMLVETWGDYPIGYYRSPLLNKLTTKDIEIESVFQFYKKFNNNRNYPTNSILFIKDGNNYVGFFALNEVEGNLESHIGGIIKKYQKGGYFYDMLRFIKEHCINNNLENFIFGARNENALVQKVFEQDGFKSVGSENVFHVASLLTHSTVEPSTIDIKIEDLTDVTLDRQITAIAEKEINQFTRFSDLHSFNMRFINKKNLGKIHRLKITFPIKDENEVLVVLKLYDTNNTLNAFAYLHKRSHINY